MKPVSVRLSRDVINQIDQLAGSKISRSAFIERVLRQHLDAYHAKRAHRRDLERINRAAARLNAEAADVLEYQSLRPSRS